MTPDEKHDSCRAKHCFALAVFLGFGLRLTMLFHAGTGDMQQYSEWGSAVLDKGLTDAFRGIYFPIQYQIFAVCSWLGRDLSLGSIVPFKLANLGFDVANLVLLLALLRRLKAAPWLALLYWFHPWFLSMFSCGYVDVQYTFFVLLMACLLLAGETWRHYLLAGIPLAFALLMKPQALILGVTAAVFGFFLSCRTRRPAPVLGLLAAPGLFFCGYSLFFFFQHKPIWHLTWLYIRVAATMPVLSAHMPNPWYVVAWCRLPPDAPIYTASARDTVFGPLTFHFLAMVLTALSLLSAIAWFALHGKKNLANQPLLLALACGSLTMPFLMTAAHENHAFGATVLLVLLIPLLRDRLYTWAVQGLMLSLFVNVFLVYDRLAGSLRTAYTPHVRVAVAAGASILFLMVIWRLLQSGIDRSRLCANGRGLTDE